MRTVDKLGELIHKTHINTEHKKCIFPRAQKESLLFMPWASVNTEDYNWSDVNPTTDVSCCEALYENVSNSVRFSKLNQVLFKAHVSKWYFKAYEQEEYFTMKPLPSVTYFVWKKNMKLC